MLSSPEKMELFTRGYIHCSDIKLGQTIIDEMEGVKDKKTYTGILPIRFSSEIYNSTFLKVDQVHYASDQIKSMVASQEVGLNLAEALNAKTIQLWATSLYFFDANNNRSFLGVHTDSKYTSFISGEYCSLLIPSSDIEFWVIPGVSKLNDNDELNSPIASDIDEQVNQFGRGFEIIRVKKGDGIIFHSSCLKGISLDVGQAFVLAAYYRTEKNMFKKNENNFGMLSYIDNFSLSPILFHRANNNV